MKRVENKILNNHFFVLLNAKLYNAFMLTSFVRLLAVEKFVLLAYKMHTKMIKFEGRKMLNVRKHGKATTWRFRTFQICVKNFFIIFYHINFSFCFCMPKVNLFCVKKCLQLLRVGRKNVSIIFCKMLEAFGLQVCGRKPSS